MVRYRFLRIVMISIGVFIFFSAASQASEDDHTCYDARRKIEKDAQAKLTDLCNATGTADADFSSAVKDAQSALGGAGCDVTDLNVCIPCDTTARDKPRCQTVDIERHWK
jgi:hypothetical protein